MVSNCNPYIYLPDAYQIPKNQTEPPKSFSSPYPSKSDRAVCRLSQETFSDISQTTPSKIETKKELKATKEDQKAKVAAVCKKHGVELKQYQDFIEEFERVNEGKNNSQRQWSPIYKAIACEDEQMVRLLIDLNVPINGSDSFKRTPLLFAIKQGKLSMVKLLVELGACPFLPDGREIMPVHAAIRNSDPQMVKLLIQHGVKINAIDIFGNTPLCYAINEKKYDMVNFLVKKMRASVNLDSDGVMPLHWAINLNDTDMVELLLELGADPNINHEGQNSLVNFAVKLNRPKIVDLLKEYGAAIDHIDKGNYYPIEFAADNKDKPMIDWLKQSGLDVDKKQQDGKSLLTNAYLDNNTVRIAALISAGADDHLANKTRISLELAQIWGLSGNITEEHKNRPYILKFAGFKRPGAIIVFNKLVDNFFKVFAVYDDYISAENQNKIKIAVSQAYPYVNLSNETIIDEYIKADQPYIILGGSIYHTVAIVFCKGKLIICNRGEGRQDLACVIYDLPASQLTTELIDKLKKRYQNMFAFNHMVAWLGLKQGAGVQQKNQRGLYCNFASFKGALRILFHLLAKDEKKGLKLYKLFTHKGYREFYLDYYLNKIQPPNRQLLELIQVKLSKKNGFKAAKKMVASALKQESKEDLKAIDYEIPTWLTAY